MVTITLSAAGAKKAASRLREFMAADGIRLKQTHAYEALAQTLGYANWNTLQALLNTTAAPENAASSAATTQGDQQTARTDEELRAELARAAAALRQRAEEQGRKPMLSGNLEQTLRRALGLASARHHQHATLEHLLLALTEDPDAVPVLQACQVDLEQLRKELTELIDSKLDDPVIAAPGEPKPTADFQRVVQRAAIHVTASGREEVTGANVLVALFSEDESRSIDFLRRQGMTRVNAVNYISNDVGKYRPPQAPTAGVPVEPRPKPKPPLKAEAKE